MLWKTYLERATKLFKYFMATILVVLKSHEMIPPGIPTFIQKYFEQIFFRMK